MIIGKLICRFADVILRGFILFILKFAQKVLFFQIYAMQKSKKIYYYIATIIILSALVLALLVWIYFGVRMNRIMY